MEIFRYEIYYSYKPTLSNPLLDELSEEEVERNIGLLIEGLGNHFGDIGGSVESSPNRVISITTDLEKNECDKVVGTYLSDLNLQARKVSERKK